MVLESAFADIERRLGESPRDAVGSGCEAIMGWIVREVDRSPLKPGETLLTRMANPFGQKRPAVLSQDCCDLLRLLADTSAALTFRVFRDEVRSFFVTDDEDDEA